ncbi:hypothetical protein AK830_g4089 [Neonectria ditissima]|uniref:Glycoside hydrolase 131 catalytic N-terminal domain-containing protein n=1 Tax=Neonectria ditissima TaxID=78410 RepID=A0A0P7BNT5_9HYPO|nr:hypothetical protein AK830_g4089 [Neonectria ditissima]
MKTFAAFASLAGLAAAEILWDGRFNDLESSADLADWSWSNQVGPYQYYIHGDGEVTEYVNLAADFANPADAGSSQGAKISLTDTAYWNGQTMRRTELIPQTSAAIAAGKVYYHFSIKRADENAPSLTREHQIAFFESHFTELKSGLSGTEDNLQWFVGGTSKWEAEWAAGVWHNIAYEIDFDASTVGLWHSTGADALTQVVKPVTASTSSNGADWHVGVLELANGDADETEDFYFSGVYIEDGELTTAISSSKSSGNTGSSASASAISSGTPTTAVAKTSTKAVATPTLAGSSTTLVSKAASSAQATSAAAKSSTAKTTPAAVQTSAAAKTSVALTTSVAVPTSTPVESAAIKTSSTSAAAATATQKSRCKRSRHKRHVVRSQ